MLKKLKSIKKIKVDHLIFGSFHTSNKKNSNSANNYSIQNFKAQNEPTLDYLADSFESKSLKETLSKYVEQTIDIPIVIGDEEIRTNDYRYQVLPFDHEKKIAKFYYADKQLIEKAIKSSVAAQADWDKTPLEQRAKVFLKAADTLSNVRRNDIVAATMLGQSKTVFQAEIDAACELIDFLRFNVQFAFDILKYKPGDVGNHSINNMHYRGLEGFIAAISPFNFTAIGGNLVSAPALMGNSVIFKPSDSAILASYIFYKILRQSGKINFILNCIKS